MDFELCAAKTGKDVEIHMNGKRKDAVICLGFLIDAISDFTQKSVSALLDDALTIAKNSEHGKKLS